MYLPGVGNFWLIKSLSLDRLNPLPPPSSLLLILIHFDIMLLVQKLWQWQWQVYVRQRSRFWQGSVNKCNFQSFLQLKFKHFVQSDRIQWDSRCKIIVCLIVNLKFDPFSFDTMFDTHFVVYLIRLIFVKKLLLHILCNSDMCRW